MATKKQSCKGSHKRLKVVEKKCVSKSNKFNKTATQKQLTNLLNRLKKMTKSKSKTKSKGSKRKNCPKGSRRVGRICRSTADLNFLKVKIEQGMSPKDARAALKEAKMKAVTAAMGVAAAAPAAKKSAGAAPAKKVAAAPAAKKVAAPAAAKGIPKGLQAYQEFAKYYRGLGLAQNEISELWKETRADQVAAAAAKKVSPAAKKKFAAGVRKFISNKSASSAARPAAATPAAARPAAAAPAAARPAVSTVFPGSLMSRLEKGFTF